MRYDRIATFYKDGEPKLNTSTGEYDKSPVKQAVMIANVTQVGTDRQVATFGELDQTSLTVRTDELPPVGWSYLMLDGSSKHYKQTTSRNYTVTHTLIVSEVK